MKTQFFLLLFLVLLFAVGGIVWWSFSGQKTKESVSVSPRPVFSSPVVSSPASRSSDDFGKLVQGQRLGVVDFLNQISPKSFVVAGTIHQVGKEAVTLQGENGELGTYNLSDAIPVAIPIPEEKSWKRVGVNESGLQKGDNVELYVTLEKDGSYYVSLIQVMPPEF